MKSDKANMAEKQLERISTFHDNAKLVVKLRNRLEQEIFGHDVKNLTQFNKVQGRMSNFKVCLDNTAIPDFNNFTKQAQMATIKQYQHDKEKVKEYLELLENEGETFFYQCLNNFENLVLSDAQKEVIDQSIRFYER